MALYWLEAGYIDDSLAYLSARELVRFGFEAWEKRHLGTLEHMPPINLGYACSGNTGFQRTAGDEWLFTLEIDSGMYRFMEPRYNDIEAKAPGLFEAALHEIERVGCAVGWLATPLHMRYQAGYMLWCGNDDQEIWFEEMLANGHDEESIKEYLSPQGYDNSFPHPWLLDCKKRLSDRVIGKLSKQTADTELADIARCVKALRGVDVMRVAQCLSPPEDCQTVYPTAILRWNSDDEIGRALDDFIHEANNCGDGFTAAISFEPVEHGLKGFNEWRGRMEKVFHALRLINQLIGLVSVPDTE